MKIILFALIIISIVLVSGVSGCAKETVCNKPYIKVGTECCLDNNDNSICDKDETSQSQQDIIQKTGNQSETPKYNLSCVSNCNRGVEITSQEIVNEQFIVTFSNNNQNKCNMSCYSIYKGALQIDIPYQKTAQSNFSFDYVVGNRIACNEVEVADSPCDSSAKQAFEAK